MISDSQGNVHWANVDTIVSSATGRTTVCTTANSCSTRPNYSHANFTDGTATSVNQAWVK